MNTAISHLMALKWYGDRNEAYAEGHDFVFKRVRDKATHKMKFYLIHKSELVTKNWSYKAFCPEVRGEWSEPFWQHEGWTASKWTETVFVYRKPGCTVAVLEEKNLRTEELIYTLSSIGGDDPIPASNMTWRTLTDALNSANSALMESRNDEVTRPIPQSAL